MTGVPPYLQPTSGARRHPVDLGTSSRPTVSVLVLSYNYGRFLAPCVTSILDQDGVNVDVVIVDDASTDDTAEVAERLGRDERVTVRTNATNHGQLRSMNENVELLRGDYVTKIDADDLLPPGSLRRSCALFEADPSIGLVYGFPLHFEGEVPTVPDDAPSSWRVWKGTDWIDALAQTSASVISQPESLIRRTALQQAGQWNESLGHTFDLEMWLRLASQWNVGRVVGTVQGLYRVHPDSLQRTLNAGKVIDLGGRLDAFESALGRSDAPAAARNSLSTARRQLARVALSEAARSIERDRWDAEEVAELTAIAERADPGCHRSSAWRALQRRLEPPTAARPMLRSYYQGRAAVRRLDQELAAAHWRRTGV